MSPAVLAVTGALAVAGAAAAAAAGRLPGAPPAPPAVEVVLLAAALSVAGALWLRVERRGQADMVDLSETVLLVALVTLPGPLLVVVVALTRALAQGVRRVTPVKLWFNVAQWTAAAGAGALVVATLRGAAPGAGRELAALLAGTAAMVAVNAVAVAAVLRIVAPRPGDAPRRSVLGLPAWAGHRALTVSVGLLFVGAWQWSPLTLPALLVALVALHVGSRAAASGWVSAVRLLGLQRANRLLFTASDPRDVVGDFLTELRRVFECRTAELQLVDGDQVTAWIVEGTVSRVAVTDRLRLSGGLDPPRGLAAPLRVEGQVVGVLRVDDRSGVSGFEEGELAVLTAAAGLLCEALQRAEAQDRLAHRAAHDPLTSLPNRALFLDRLAHTLQRGRRDASSALVLFLDIDNFKDVNDSLGHRAGDQLLCHVADRLQGVVRPGDTVARFGGDEFTILCESIRDEIHAVEVADRIFTALSRPFCLEGHELFVRASIGLALAGDPSTDPDVLIENADAAMYRAKERGGESYEVYDEGMRARAVTRLATKNALYRAIERGEFELLYQPIVSLATGDILGVEALVRWRHPDHGLLLPSRFIPIAEESGLIVPIGEQVLGEACRQAAAWAQGDGGGPGLSMSVNLSPRQLADPHLVDTVARAVGESGADPGRIHIEITENAIMNDVEASEATLTRLKGLGVRLLVDDFGTGYSSLSYLQRLPVDGLKVDRSFVARLGSHDGDETIVRSVVNLAHNLGMVAVAEGIETEGQAACLRALECELGQGFWWGRPMPAEHLGEILLTPASRTGPRGTLGAVTA